MLKPIVMATPATVELDSAFQAIEAHWVLGGKPQARWKTLVRSSDLNSHVDVWECTAGRFNWHYRRDETVLVVSGEAFMINENGEERRFGPGDVGFFPAGTACTWRVPNGFRKVAVVREAMWGPVGYVLKAWNKARRTLGAYYRSARKPANELRMRVERV